VARSDPEWTVAVKATAAPVSCGLAGDTSRDVVVGADGGAGSGRGAATPMFTMISLVSPANWVFRGPSIALVGPPTQVKSGTWKFVASRVKLVLVAVTGDSLFKVTLMGVEVQDELTGAEISMSAVIGKLMETLPSESTEPTPEPGVAEEYPTVSVEPWFFSGFGGALNVTFEIAPVVGSTLPVIVAGCSSASGALP
jgi:hypothetical protein